VATLAAPYAPRRPTETVLYGLVRQNLESFLAYAREHYDGGLPRYVENELRAYLKCGVFSEASVSARCSSEDVMSTRIEHSRAIPAGLVACNANVGRSG
jgi:hypothetical protein